MTEQEEKQFLQVLIDSQQQELIEKYHKIEASQEKVDFMVQVLSINNAYPGGLSAYVKNSKTLMKEYVQKKSKFDEFELEAPESYNLSLDNLDELLKYENIGKDELQNCGFVLLAGGLGERMGFHGVKPALEMDSILKISFFKLYMMFIKAFQDLFNFDENGQKIGEIELQIVIMTSDDTHNPLLKYLEENEYFKLSSCQFHLLKQEKVPCFTDENVKLSLDPNSEGMKLLTKPHGHGDIHSLMHTTGTAQKIYEKGCKYIITCNDTNPLSFRFLASYLGLVKEKELHLAYLAIPRVPNEAVGALCTVKSKSQTFTTNIEYNFMEQILKEGNEPINEETGFSMFPGNTNIMIIKLDEYIEVLKQTGGQVPEFIGPKFKEGTNEMIAPARLESLVAEYPYLLKNGEKVGVINLDRLMIFTCAKNSIQNGIDKRVKNLPMDTLASCEFEWYYANCLILKKVCGVNFLADTNDEDYPVKIDKNGIPVYKKHLTGVDFNIPPVVSILPTFGVLLTQIIDQISSTVTISYKSSLFLSGKSSLKNVVLDGSLLIENDGLGCLDIDNLKITDQKYIEFNNLEVFKDEQEQTRGFSADLTSLKKLQNCDF